MSDQSGELSSGGGNGAAVADRSSNAVELSGGSQSSDLVTPRAGADRQQASAPAPSTPATPDPWTPEFLEESSRRGYDAETTRQRFTNPDAMRAAFSHFDHEMMLRGEAALAGQYQPAGAMPGMQPGFSPAARAPAGQASPPPAGNQGQGQPVPIERLQQILATPYSLPQNHNFDPAFAEQLNGIAAHANQQLFAMGHLMMGWLRNLQESFQSGEDRRATEVFDGRVLGLGEDWKEIFGAGPFDELAPTSVGYKNRQALADAVHAIRTGYLVTGRNPPPDREILQHALAQKFGPHFNKLAEAKASKNVADRLRGSDGRYTKQPDSRAAGGANGTKAANGLTPDLNQWFDKHGIPEG